MIYLPNTGPPGHFDGTTNKIGATNCSCRERVQRIEIRWNNMLSSRWCKVQFFAFHISLQTTKHSCTVISIPPSGCIDLNVYYGGREICWAIVQMLSNSAKARQISPSRKRHLTIEILLAQSKWRQQADNFVTLMIIYVYKQSILSLKPNEYVPCFAGTPAGPIWNAPEPCWSLFSV